MTRTPSPQQKVWLEMPGDRQRVVAEPDLHAAVNEVLGKLLRRAVRRNAANPKAVAEEVLALKTASTGAQLYAAAFGSLRAAGKVIDRIQVPHGELVLPFVAPT